MELYEVMRTTFAARAFTDERVADEQIARILEHARFAPSGGNRQGWRVVVVREHATREALAPLIEPTFRRYLAEAVRGESPWNTIQPSAVTPADVAATPSPARQVRAVLAAPVLLLVYVDLSVVASFDSGLDRVGVISGASVYPFVWNILLAARNEGLGGVLTTFAAAREPDVQRLVGAPEQLAFAALVPLGRPVRQLTRLRRNPVATFATLERFDGPPLAPTATL
jgi:nitroreductase